MTNEKFEELLVRRVTSIKLVLGVKAKEYAHGGDRLHDFRKAAKMGMGSAQFAAWGMMMKHLVSVSDLVEGRLENTRHNVDEKIGDLINYLILLEAVLDEDRAATEVAQ